MSDEFSGISRPHGDSNRIFPNNRKASLIVL